jgi:hypothetical protein
MLNFHVGEIMHIVYLQLLVRYQKYDKNLE